METGICFEQFKEQIDALANLEESWHVNGNDVVISLHQPGLGGPKPSVPVIMAYKGIDWEMNQVRIEPASPLYSLDYLKMMIPDIEEQLESACHRRL